MFTKRLALAFWGLFKQVGGGFSIDGMFGRRIGGTTKREAKQGSEARKRREVGERNNKFMYCS